MRLIKVHKCRYNTIQQYQNLFTRIKSVDVIKKSQCLGRKTLFYLNLNVSVVSLFRASVFTIQVLLRVVGLRGRL